ncbi:T9SS type A sorting domain-containing protein [bacterium]|nr:T9SS type A sorting domain-containing protein [bacterium]
MNLLLLCRDRFVLIAVILLILVTFCTQETKADTGDTTTVYTFIEQNHNWTGEGSTTHTETFTFPDGSTDYNQAIMTYRISCPPGGCDPWDRIANLYVVNTIDDSTEDVLEIARIITPYNIVGGGGPGTCAWEFDMIDYLPILRGEVTLRSYIETYIGPPQGWECTVTFYFIEGELPIKPYRVVNLWRAGYLPYGDPDRPPESVLGNYTVDIDDIAESATLRIVTTGHGQGNTDNAAEFSRKDHGVVVGGAQIFEQELWRSDCAQNPCSPQGGTWQYNRAGWCPGQKVNPWDITTIQLIPGAPLDIWYFLEAYENFCRPTNPNCVSGVTCSDCNYNSTGHTEPNYCTTGQLILWSSQTSTVAPPMGRVLPTRLALMQNYPNPFNPVTTIRFSLPTAGHTRLSVYNVAGQEVAVLTNGNLSAGSHSVNFDGAALSSGVYFYSLTSGDITVTKKMLLMK